MTQDSNDNQDPPGLPATSSESSNSGSGPDDAKAHGNFEVAPDQPSADDAPLPPIGPRRNSAQGKAARRKNTEPKANKAKSAKLRSLGAAEKRARNVPPPNDEVNSMDTMDNYLRGTRLGASPPLPPEFLPASLQALFPDSLSACAVLATTGAVMGQGVQLTRPDGSTGPLALRVAIVGADRRLPDALIPILDAVYKLQEEETQTWADHREKDKLANAAEEARRKLRRQIIANAGLLGCASGLQAELGPEQQRDAVENCPRLAARDARPKDLDAALQAGRSGILVVDGRRMPNMAPYGMNYDTAAANLLNLAAAGRPLEIPADRRNGIRMRGVSISIIGVLSIVDTFTLTKVDAGAFAATMFAIADAGTPPQQYQAQAGHLLDMLRQAKKLTQNVQMELTFSKSAQAAVDHYAGNVPDIAAAVRPPLADYNRQLGDTITRVAALLHVIDRCEANTDHLEPVIDKATVLRAIQFVETCLASVAQVVLGPSSEPPDLRNARRLLSYAQAFCSVGYPVVTRRELVRHFQKSISVSAVDQAVRRLVADDLFMSPNPSVEGPNLSYCVNEVVFAPANELPDLASDPRRSRP